jgi:hypothetical protein
LTFDMTGETTLTWTADDLDAFLSALAAFYGDESLNFVVLSNTDVNGNLLIEVQVSGFASETLATASYTDVSGQSSMPLGEQFGSTSFYCSAPANLCFPGYGEVDGICLEIDGCAVSPCEDGNNCEDIPAPGVGRICIDIDGCESYAGGCGANGDLLAACVDVAAPGSGYACLCSSSYGANGQVCVANCNTSPIQTGYTFASGAQSEGATRTSSCAPGYTGTGTSITCLSSTWSAATGCTIRDCGIPSASTGYVVGSAPSTTYGSTCSMTCATGYSGSATSVTCQSSGSWTISTGCMNTSGCAANPSAQTGYVISAGGSLYGDTRTVACQEGYTGTATVVTCQTSGSWTTSSGCAMVTCGTPSQSDYTVASGGSNYGDVRTVICATGYSGTASSITCQSSGSWSTSSGCTIVSCGSPTAPTGYTYASGGTTYGSTRSVTCATGYSGTSSSITCQASGSWTSPSGCNIISCSSSPTQSGYTIATGSSTYGATRTASCAAGYSGTASSITCQSSGAWTSATGCASSVYNSGYTMFKMVTTENFGATHWCIFELSFFGSSNNRFVLDSSRGTASSVWAGGGWPASGAFEYAAGDVVGYCSSFESRGAGWLQYTFPSCTPVTSYSLKRLGSQYPGLYSPKSWTLQASNDGVVWRILDVQTNVASWDTGSEVRTYSIATCPTNPFQHGYVFASGTSSVGSTRTATCASAFLSGTATSITCEASGMWTQASGCSSACAVSSGYRSFAWYRLFVTADFGSDHWCIQELSFWSPSTARITVDATRASALTQWADGYWLPRYAFDEMSGPYVNGYCTHSLANGWGPLVYSFPACTAVASYKIQRLNSPHDNSYSPYTWTFEGSVDGTSWTVLDRQVRACISISMYVCSAGRFLVRRTLRHLYAVLRCVTYALCCV